jgi:hypothetical protein
MPAPRTGGLRSPKILHDSDRESESSSGLLDTWQEEDSTAPSGDLSAKLRECVLGGSRTTHVFGIGNPMKQDDGVGLEVVSSLRRRLGPASRKAVRVHGLSSNPERIISDLASKGERIVIIDAVEAQKKPGTIVCARLSDTKFGFFATTTFRSG